MRNLEGILPIGTIVSLKGSERRVMIMGIAQKERGSEDKIWDYSACLFPEGYLGADQVYLFDNEQIDMVYAIGYQDKEQSEFKKKAEMLLEELKGDK